MKKWSGVAVSVVVLISLFIDYPVYPSINSAADENQATVEKDDPFVYVKGEGTKYHKKNCQLVATGKKGIKLSEVLKKGYEPCKICNPPATTVYVNPSGTVYHRKGCKMIHRNALKISPSEAKNKNLKACKICFPPKGENK